MDKKERITAVFDSTEEAQATVKDLKAEGIPEANIGLITRSPNGEVHEETGEGLSKGAAVGGGLGAALGLGAGVATGFIPGAGPFIAAGVLTSWLGTVAGSAVSGAVVGGTTGALAGALEERAGYSKGEAEYYGDLIERGGTLVAVDVSGPVREQDVMASVKQHHGSMHVGAAA